MHRREFQPLPTTLLGESWERKKELHPPAVLRVPLASQTDDAREAAWLFSRVFFSLSSPGAAFETFVILCVEGLISQALGWLFIFYIFGELLSGCLLLPTPPPPPSPHPLFQAFDPRSKGNVKSAGAWQLSQSGLRDGHAGHWPSKKSGQPHPSTPSVHCRVPTSPSEMPGLLLHVVKRSRLETCILNISHVSWYFIMITISPEKPSTYYSPQETCNTRFKCAFPLGTPGRVPSRSVSVLGGATDVYSLGWLASDCLSPSPAPVDCNVLMLGTPFCHTGFCAVIITVPDLRLYKSEDK